MQSKLVFTEKDEIKRLRVQNELLSCYEVPVLARILSEGRGLSVLDIGCNDGNKTVERFTSESVSCVIGLEYNEALAKKSQRLHGKDGFSFYRFDVEAEDLSGRLSALMKERQIDGFDVIYLSFVLMHLSDVGRLLTALRGFLKADGKLFIVEADDSTSTLSNDGEGLLDEFLEMLKKDKFSGNREVGATICKTLSECGYDDIHVWHDAVSAGEGEREKKKAIFTTFFSYFPEDVQLLLEAEPENEEYLSWSLWLDKNYKALKRRILQDGSAVSMGMKILTCTKGKE